MKSLLILIAATCLATPPLPGQIPALNQPQTGPRPGTEYQKLQPWLGEWTYESETIASPVGAKASCAGTMSARPILNGFAVEFVFKEPRPWGAKQWLEIDWFDPVTRKLRYLSLSNDGGAETGSLSIAGYECNWEGAFMARGMEWKSRGTGLISPHGLFMTQRGEVSADGKKWVRSFTRRATKIVDGAITGIEKELIQLERDWATAYLTRDADLLDRIEADDWFCTDAGGTVQSKREDIANVTSGDWVAAVFEISDLKIRLFDDTAVVSGRQTVKAARKGREDSAAFQITDVWRRQDGRWQAIARHLSRITTPVAPSGNEAVDTKTE